MAGDVLDSGLRVEPRAADHAVAGAPGPAHHEDARLRRAGGGIEHLVGGGRVLARHREVEPVLVRQARVLVHPVAHREDHGVRREHRGLAGADRGDAVAVALEAGLLDLEADHAAPLRHHPPGRGQKAEAEAGAGAGGRLGPGCERAERLVGVLARGQDPRPYARDLLAVEGVVEGVLDVLELAVVVRLLERPTTRDRDDLVAVGEVGAVVRDVHHHVADADDGHAAAHREGPLAEGRQPVVVVDEILGVVDAREALAVDSEILRALRADRVDERIESHGRQLAYREVALVGDRDMPEIGYERIAENLLELSSQAALHLVLVEEDAVLGEAARLDVPVEKHHAGAAGGERAGGEEPGGPRADHRDEMHRIVGHERRDHSIWPQNTRGST
jgi:hypothetical protein